MKARIYARVSTVEQAEEGYSIDAQLSQNRKWIESNQHTLTGEYIDEGRSGKSVDKRPELLRALEDAKNHEYDVLVVHKLDRFSRSLLDTLLLLRNLNSCQVTLVSITEQYDFTTPGGKMFLNMIASLAEWYLANLSMEVKKGNREKAAQGYWHGKVPPVGYRLINGELVPHQHERATVTTLFEMYAAARYSIPQLNAILRACLRNLI